MIALAQVSVWYFKLSYDSRGAIVKWLVWSVTCGTRGLLGYKVVGKKLRTWQFIIVWWQRIQIKKGTHLCCLGLI